MKKVGILKDIQTIKDSNYPTFVSGKLVLIGTPGTNNLESKNKIIDNSFNTIKK
jgi:hypothetical protein